MKKEISLMEYKILETPDEIIKHIQMGTHLPVFSELEKYIRFDLEDMKCKSLLFNENEKLDTIAGHVMVFPIFSDLLGFGYFRVVDHSKERIEKLISILIQYAKENGFKEVYGPLNIPIYIFGFGFHEQDEPEFIHSGLSHHPSIYSAVFQRCGFRIKTTYLSYETHTPRINPHTIPNMDFSEYRMRFFNNRSEFEPYQDRWLKLHAEHMPSDIRLTPNLEREIINLIDYTFEFGYPNVFYCIEYVPTGELVSAGINPQDCFQFWNNGLTLSWCKVFLGLDFVVSSEHRNKKLSILMWGECTMRCAKEGKTFQVNYLVESENVNSIKIIARFWGTLKRRYLLFT